MIQEIVTRPLMTKQRQSQQKHESKGKTKKPVKNKTSKKVSKKNDVNEQNKDIKQIQEIDAVIEKYMNLDKDSKNFNLSRKDSDVVYRKRSANKKRYLCSFRRVNRSTNKQRTYSVRSYDERSEQQNQQQQQINNIDDIISFYSEQQNDIPQNLLNQYLNDDPYLNRNFSSQQKIELEDKIQTLDNQWLKNPYGKNQSNQKLKPNHLFERMSHPHFQKSVSLNEQDFTAKTQEQKQDYHIDDENKEENKLDFEKEKINGDLQDYEFLSDQQKDQENNEVAKEENQQEDQSQEKVENGQEEKVNYEISDDIEQDIFSEESREFIIQDEKIDPQGEKYSPIRNRDLQNLGYQNDFEVDLQGSDDQEDSKEYIVKIEKEEPVSQSQDIDQNIFEEKSENIFSNKNYSFNREAFMGDSEQTSKNPSKRSSQLSNFFQRDSHIVVDPSGDVIRTFSLENSQELHGLQQLVSKEELETLNRDVTQNYQKNQFKKQPLEKNYKILSNQGFKREKKNVTLEIQRAGTYLQKKQIKKNSQQNFFQYQRPKFEEINENLVIRFLQSVEFQRITALNKILFKKFVNSKI